MIDEMATHAVDWTDEQLATKIVQLLILNKGVVNAWSRTIELMIKIIRKREQIMLSKETAKATP